MLEMTAAIDESRRMEQNGDIIFPALNAASRSAPWLSPGIAFSPSETIFEIKFIQLAYYSRRVLNKNLLCQKALAKIIVIPTLNANPLSVLTVNPGRLRGNLVNYDGTRVSFSEISITVSGRFRRQLFNRAASSPDLLLPTEIGNSVANLIVTWVAQKANRSQFRQILLWKLNFFVFAIFGLVSHELANRACDEKVCRIGGNIML